MNCLFAILFMVYHQIIFLFPQVMSLGRHPIILYHSKILILYHHLYFILTLKQCFVPTFDDPAKGFTTGKICSSINSIAGFDVPTETSKDHLAAKDIDTNDDLYSIINNLKIKYPN